VQEIRAGTEAKSFHERLAFCSCARGSRRSGVVQRGHDIAPSYVKDALGFLSIWGKSVSRLDDDIASGLSAHV
jgi:hypothetical protein